MFSRHEMSARIAGSNIVSPKCKSNEERDKARRKERKVE
jgi:hypothetical protein